MRAVSGIGVVAALLLVASPSSLGAEDRPLSLQPQEIFENAAPQVFMVESLGRNGEVLTVASGVAVSSDSVVTTQHIAAGAFRYRVRQGQRKWEATITHVDPQHDLCRLLCWGLKAPGASTRSAATLRMGERVYTVGVSEGLELAVSEGVISGLHPYDATRLIRTTAPISQGSSGGGLFDADGRLVGITAVFIRNGQNFNLALPSDWVMSLERRPIREHTSKQKSNAEVFSLLAAAFGLHRDPPKGIPLIRQAITLRPSDPNLWYYLGWFQFYANDYLNARKSLKTAISLGADHAESWLYLASSYSATNETDKAYECFKKSLQFEPEPLISASAWRGIGHLLISKGQYNEAVQAGENAVRLKPDYSEGWTLLGSAYLIIGEVNKAITALEEAIRLDKFDTRPYLMLGLAYDRAGRRSDLTQLYERLREINTKAAEEFFKKYVL
ncbi:MAG TPA: tetratricopeptide repeat-containing serine protease family protein [Syntrophobacteria bacterium]|nr:tetratricopeptide repeat-containing serine protease family protein [Syntrophobacteria bacterium]